MKKSPLQTFFRFGAASSIALALILQSFFAANVSAAQITNRSLTLQAGATEGGSKMGGVVNHFFEFALPSNTIGSIKFEYCTTAAISPTNQVCIKPTGLTTAGVTLGSESGATGFTSIDPTTTDGVVIISRASAASASGSVAYQLSGVTNPTSEGTFFVRISTYASTDASGSTLDSGSVAASTAEQIIIDGTMPESLVFCTGANIDNNVSSGVPDCSTATAGTISFNQLFSPTDTATAVNEMAASTNAGFGYAISVNGPTLTSGSNTITAMNTAATASGTRGTSRFGLNLKANTTASSTSAIGAEVAPVGNGTNYRGRAAAGYDTVDTFKFTSGETVATSDDNGAGGSAPGGTDAQIYTVSYIANVPGNQPAGTYTSTLTYICTPRF